MKKLFKAAAVLLAALTLTACGGSKSEPTAPEPDPYTEIPCGSGTVMIRIDDTLPKSSFTENQFYSDENGRVYYSGSEYEAAMGVDVSSHQQEIDWQQAAADGVSFAFIRAGYRGYESGELHTDTLFWQNLQNAEAAGIRCGVYFYSQALSVDEAREEGQYLAELLSGVTLDLPVIYDWEINEADTSRTLDADVTQITDYALVFCDELENAGFETGIYFSRYVGYFSYDLTRLQDKLWWSAAIGSWPDFYYAHTLWQYNFEGTVAGISTVVDLNMMFEPIS